MLHPTNKVPQPTRGVAKTTCAPTSLLMLCAITTTIMPMKEKLAMKDQDMMMSLVGKKRQRQSSNNVVRSSMTSTIILLCYVFFLLVLPVQTSDISIESLRFKEDDDNISSSSDLDEIINPFTTSQHETASDRLRGLSSRIRGGRSFVVASAPSATAASIKFNEDKDDPRSQRHRNLKGGMGGGRKGNAFKNRSSTKSGEVASLGRNAFPEDPTNPRDCYAFIDGPFGPVISLVGRGIRTNAANTPNFGGRRDRRQRRRRRLQTGEETIVRRGYGTGSLGRRLYVPPHLYWPKVNFPQDCYYEVVRPSAPSPPRTQPPVQTVAPVGQEPTRSREPSEQPSTAPSISDQPSLSHQPSIAPSISNRPTISNAPTIAVTRIEHRYTAIIEYAQLFGTTVRAPTTAEYNGVIDQTDLFLTAQLQTIYSTFNSIRGAFVSATFDQTAVPTSSTDVKYAHAIRLDGFFLFETSTGQFIPSATELRTTLTNLPTQTYVQNYVWNSLPTTSVFRNTFQVRWQYTSTGTTTL